MLHDRDIREPLFDFLEERLGKIRIIEEKTMGRSRADIVMVLPEALAGIEIKSDADTYARLGRQVEDYDRYFDFNYVVVGSTHGAHIREHVPQHWGVISVEEPADGKGALDFYVIREAVRNPYMEPDKKYGFCGVRSLPVSRKKTACTNMPPQARNLCAGKYLSACRQSFCGSRFPRNCLSGTTRQSGRRWRSTAGHTAHRRVREKSKSAGAKRRVQNKAGKRRQSDHTPGAAVCMAAGNETNMEAIRKQKEKSRI